jgi:hypothetical protein
MTVTITDADAEQALNALAERFAEWRQTRASSAERIPPLLWEQAADLSTVLPSSRVAKRLRLDGGELKRQRRTRCDAQSVTPTFVEFAFPRMGHGAEVEIERPEGARLRIRYAAEPPLAALVQAFLGCCCSSRRKAASS